MKIVAIVQARMGSTRLPGKVMKPICNSPMIEFLLKRLSRSELIDQIILAAPDTSDNLPMINHVKRLGFETYQGSEHDVLKRYMNAAGKYNADVIVRVTGDCPLIDAGVVDKVISHYLDDTEGEYCTNCNPPMYPDGLDVEVFSINALKKSSIETNDVYDREHVTPFIRESGKFNTSSYIGEEDFSTHRWTVDEEQDLRVVSRVFEHFWPNIYFKWTEVLELENKVPEVFLLNSGVQRNEGANMNNGQKLWKRAKNIIPGGNMLLSKRPEMFLPDQWPAYFSESKGCMVWDLDGNKYTDVSIMGIGTNILGYGHPEVDEAVQQVVKKGNMSTLNCPEEVYLAEKLIAMHSWADMVRFARSGGEANAIAIRIARAASGKDNVAVCGYHGWHDWYLSANLGDEENLSSHLLPGLEPNGVPANLKHTVYPFEYNDYESLLKLVKDKDIGVIKMEVVRNIEPNNDFLNKVRQLATNEGIVLIFDECTSGFRETFGGLHKKYGVEPDMAMFGKALGNGYAITATIGRREVMEAAQTSFISSTFWTERIGPAAALKTLEVMEREKSWEQITDSGLYIREHWQKLADLHGLEISHWGLPALTGFSFTSENAIEYKTLITQEMLKKGYLAANSVYVSVEHSKQILDEYYENLNYVFGLIRECEDGRDINKLLRGPACHTGFKRLN